MKHELGSSIVTIENLKNPKIEAFSNTDFHQSRIDLPRYTTVVQQNHLPSANFLKWVNQPKHQYPERKIDIHTRTHTKSTKEPILSKPSRVCNGSFQN